MKVEFELGDNREVAATATNCPKQIRVFIFAGPDFLTIGGDRVHGDKIVNGQAVFAS